MIIFLAGLMQISEERYGASSVEGAGKARQPFTQAFIVSGGSGGPLDSTMSYSLYLYLFKDYRDSGLVPPSDVAAGFIWTNGIAGYQAATKDELALINFLGSDRGASASVAARAAVLEGIDQTAHLSCRLSGEILSS
jgi:hypothetical protein